MSDLWVFVDNMDIETAKNIMDLRYNKDGSYRGTWRWVAEQMGDEQGNQLYGLNLCKKAKEVLGDSWIGEGF